MPFTSEQIRSMIAKSEDVLVTVSASAAVIIAALTEKARKRGEDRSFDYWLEECVINGAKAFERSWEYSDTSRDSREFKKAVANSKIKFIGGVPANLQEQIAFAELCVKFHQFDVTNADVIALKEQAAKAASQNKVAVPNGK